MDRAQQEVIISLKILAIGRLIQVQVPSPMMAELIKVPYGHNLEGLNMLMPENISLMLVFAGMVHQFLLTTKDGVVFPSVSVAWRISEEDFLKSVSFINDLKLSYSWGKMGSTSNVDPTNPYNLYSSRAGKSAYDLAGNST